MKHVLSLGFLLLNAGWAWGSPFEPPTNSPPQSLQDPTTKVIFYLESDLRHVAALNPDGHVLWCCEVIPESLKTISWIREIRFGASDGKNATIHVEIWRMGIGAAEIDEKTGVCHQNPLTQ